MEPQEWNSFMFRSIHVTWLPVLPFSFPFQLRDVVGWDLRERRLIQLQVTVARFSFGCFSAGCNLFSAQSGKSFLDRKEAARDQRKWTPSYFKPQHLLKEEAEPPQTTCSYYSLLSCWWSNPAYTKVQSFPPEAFFDFFIIPWAVKFQTFAPFYDNKNNSTI